MNTNLNRNTVLLFVFIAHFMIFSCTKDMGIIEYRLSANHQDFSIPTDIDLVKMQLISDDTIYILGHHDSLENTTFFKSFDSGLTWQQTTIPATLIQEANDMVFLDSQYGGVLLDEYLYLTQDGGTTWSPYGIPASGVRLASDGYYLFADQYINGADVYFVPKDGGSSSVAFSFNTGIVYLEKAISAGEKTFFVYINPYSSSYDGFDFETGSDFHISFNPSINAYEETVDIAFGNGEYIAAHKKGKIISILGNGQNFNNHTRDYTAIDFGYGFFVVVGDRTIGSNYLGDWVEVMKFDGLAFQYYFRDVEITGSDSFVVCGNKGLFQKYSFK